MVNGETITLQQLSNGSVQIERGTFIVGSKDKADVLKRMKEKFDWEPSNAMSDMMPMFIGQLDQNHVIWLLSQAGVEYVEADAVVIIHKK